MCIYSEKLYKALSSSTIPIVYGAENVHEFAPPHSYIDTRKFKSTKELAAYIIQLDKNDTQYLSYFTWKKHYSVKKGMYSLHDVFCKFCKYLHTTRKQTVLQNFKEWFFQKSGCIKPGLGKK